MITEFKIRYIPGLGVDLACAVVLAGEVGVLGRLVRAAEKGSAAASKGEAVSHVTYLSGRRWHFSSGSNS